MKRGSTLAELIIVMAVVGIMTVMVISFTLITNNWVQLGTRRYNLTTSQRMAEQALRTFISEYDDGQHEFSTDGTSLIAAKDNKRQKVSFVQGVFTITEETDTVTVVDETETTTTETEVISQYPLDHVDLITYTIRDNYSQRQLIRMTIDWTIPHTAESSRDETGTYLVTITTRAIPAGGGA